MKPDSPPQRILMTADTVGGVWNYALELGRAFEGDGIEVLLATMGPRPSRDQRAEAAACRNVTLAECDFRLEWMDNPWPDLAAAGEWLRGLAESFQPDVIHLNGYAHAALPWNAPVVVVAHSCVCSWWRAVRGGDAPPQWDRYRTAVGQGLRAADGVIAPSAAMLTNLVTEYGEFEHTRVIPNGRAAADFTAAPKQPFVLGVGRLWDEAKNTAALVAIAPRLRWPVRLAGETARPGSATENRPNVEWLGRCPPAALARLYAEAAIFASPAYYEPFGLAALEAALSGCALVLGDIPSQREIWGDAALFVPPADREALAAAIGWLIDNESERRLRAARLCERARRYAPGRMAAAYLEAYGAAGARRAEMEAVA